jgi:arylsulfatase A-like enzyme
VDHQIGSNPGWIARNYPFRGHKALIWEGGTRVAGFIHSAMLPASMKGTVSNVLMHVTDWLPTIVALAGGSTDKNLPLDGHNQWPAITGIAPAPRTEMLYGINPASDGQAGPPKAGLRMGDYKVLCWSYTIEGISGGNETGPCSPCPQADDPELKKGPVLFNLAVGT